MENKQSSTQPAVVQKEIATAVLMKIRKFTETGELKLPEDYSPENAIKGAMLILDEMGAFVKYEHNSIAQSLLKMVVEGLSPLKKQGYFIPYGKALNWSRSYQGSMALAKRVGGVDFVSANVIYEGDEFEYEIQVETGLKRILKHGQRLENIDNAKIKGAYAVVVYRDGKTDLEVMTIDEIRKAWGQGATKGQSPAHVNFTQEMAKKTVINRACKTPINSSSDVILLTGKEEDDETDNFDTYSEVKEDVKAVTASEPVAFTEVKEDVVKVEKKAKVELKSDTSFDKNGQGSILEPGY